MLRLNAAFPSVLIFAVPSVTQGIFEAKRNADLHAGRQVSSCDVQFPFLL